jgi:putative ABC transport system permease protein
MVLFAGVISFGSMLNASLIEIGDRTRDIAGFRVIGYHPGQIAGIFFRQNTVIFILGLLLSLPLGYLMVYGAAQAYESELFRMPVIFKARSVLWTMLLSFVFVGLAQWVVYRQVKRLDWLEGIKVKE